MKKTYYRRKPAKTHTQWWDEKREAERLRKERRKWEDERDARIQNLMLYKEEAEDVCGDRIVQKDGKNVLQMREGDTDLMVIWGILSFYENTVTQLQSHIPNLEYDHRIKSDLHVVTCPAVRD